MTTPTTGSPSIRFLFDPSCPWTWRTSKWLRMVRRQESLEVQWELYSLGYVNREYPDESYQQSVRRLRPAFRLLELARRRLGNDAIDRLYLALGTAHHERGEDLGDVETLRRAAKEPGIDPALVTTALEDTSLDDELNAHYAAVEAAGAIAVPTLFIGNAAPLYGPVINAVPGEDEARGLWEDVLRLSRRPYFFELKRKR
jgi:predicted DsbA family dithiol-disulfide isomerase